MLIETNFCDALYKYWMEPRATLKNNARAILPSNMAQLRGIIFQCWLRLTVNICFVISRNNCNKFVLSSMMQHHRIYSDLRNTAVGPKNRKIDKNAWCYMLYVRQLPIVPLCYGFFPVRHYWVYTWRNLTYLHIVYTMFPENVDHVMPCSLHWQNRATLFIFYITWHAFDQSRSRNSDGGLLTRWQATSRSSQNRHFSALSSHWRKNSTITPTHLLASIPRYQISTYNYVLGFVVPPTASSFRHCLAIYVFCILVYLVCCVPVVAVRWGHMPPWGQQRWAQ